MHDIDLAIKKKKKKSTKFKLMNQNLVFHKLSTMEKAQFNKIFKSPELINLILVCTLPVNTLALLQTPGSTRPRRCVNVTD